MNQEAKRSTGELPPAELPEDIQLPVRLPNIASNGPFRKIVGPVAIVEKRYLEWLERGAEMNINHRVQGSETSTLQGPVGFRPPHERP